MPRVPVMAGRDPSPRARTGVRGGSGRARP